MSCEKRKQWFSVLRELQIDGAGILCAEKNSEASMLLFEPTSEQPALLRQWLAYRGVPVNDLLDAELVQITILDMIHRGNSPPFARFRYFDPAIASPQFLKLWLSWYGVTSQTEQPPAWWIKRVAALQKNAQPAKKKTHREMVAQFVQLQRAVRKQDYTGLATTFQRLTPAAIAHLNQKTAPARSWDIKRILAFALDASAIAVPFLIMHNQKYLRSVGAQVSPAVIKALKGVGVVISGNPRSTRWLETKEKQTFWDEINETGTMIALQVAQTAINRKTRDNPVLKVGQSLVSDVGALLMDEKQKIPDNVLKTIARHYLRDHPWLMVGIADVVIPSVNNYYRKK